MRRSSTKSLDGTAAEDASAVRFGPPIKILDFGVAAICREIARDDGEETLFCRYLSRVCSLSRFDVFCFIFASLAFVFVGWVVVLRHRSLSGLAYDSFLGVTFSLLLFDILKHRGKIFVLS